MFSKTYKIITFFFLFIIFYLLFIYGAKNIFSEEIAQDSEIVQYTIDKFGVYKVYDLLTDEHFIDINATESKIIKDNGITNLIDNMLNITHSKKDSSCSVNSIKYGYTREEVLWIRGKFIHRVLLPPGTNLSVFFAQSGWWHFNISNFENLEDIDFNNLSTVSDGFNPTLYKGSPLEQPKYVYIVGNIEDGATRCFSSITINIQIEDENLYTKWINQGKPKPNEGFDPSLTNNSQNPTNENNKEDQSVINSNNSYNAGIKNENDPDYFPIANIDNLEEGNLGGSKIKNDFSFEVGASNYRGEYESYDFNALYASFIGLKNYGKDIKSHIAVKMLHASSTLGTITTQIVSPQMPKPVVRIFENGKISTFSENYTPIILSEKPFKIGIFDEYESLYKGKFDFNSDNISSFHLIPPIHETEGIFVENLEGSGSITTKKNNESIDILLKNIKISTIFKDGIEIYDNHFIIKIDENKSDEGIVFLLQNKENLTIARITYRGGKWVKEERFSDVLKATDQDGYFIKEDDEQRIEIFPELQTAFSRNEFGVGFKGREKYVLEFAAGESIGESTKSSSDIFLINFGDPSLRLPPSTKNSTGFDATVGKEIYNEKDGTIKKVFKIDFDGDGHDDIASLDTSGYIKFFTNTGTGNFRLWGKGVAIDPKSKMIESINLDKDKFEDIVYADRNGELHYLQNQETIFSITDLPGYFENKTLISGGIEDVDRDGHDDFVYISSNGELSILYGKEGGFENTKIIDRYNFTLPKDSAKDILISFPYIDKIVELKEYLHPISYFSQTNNQAQSNSKLPPNYQDKYQTDRSIDEETINNLTENDEITEEKTLLEDLFAPITLFNKSIQVSKQMIIDDSKEETLGKKILTKIIITSKDSKAINFTIADPYSSLVSIEETSIQCKNCGRDIVKPIFPSSSRVIVFDDLHLAANDTLTISYSAKINALPKMEMNLGDLNKDDTIDIIVEKKGKGLLQYKSKSKREYERFIPSEK